LVMCKPVERWKVGCAFSLLRTKARYCASFLILLELTVVAYAQGGAPNEFCAGCHHIGLSPTHVQAPPDAKANFCFGCHK
ncbi:MAG: hypothetical protein K6T71_06210, partial [Candidatus Bipolaricaulota bacterium]|nr:hypothetical protein [Candidatus Bipolaricaulota bacterium]